MTDLVSIITPAYRAEACITNAVRSVLTQTHVDWEMLIVADDDRDYQQLLIDMAIDDARLRFFRTPSPQSGPNVARNIALLHAHGDWIAPLDADDLYYPQRLARLLAAAKTGGLALDNVRLVGEGILSHTVLDMDNNSAFDFGHFRSSLVPLLFLFHRRHIPCGWDEDIPRGADTLFNLRALESAGTAAFVAEPLHEYRVHGQSMCHSDNAADLFEHAYRHTLHRLDDDGLGFGCDIFRSQVIDMIKAKQKINAAFNHAQQAGFQGNYQQFVAQDAKWL